MVFQYYTDGDYSAYRETDPDATSAEVFNHSSLTWTPLKGGLGPKIINGDAQPATEAEAMRVCGVIRERVEARRAAGGPPV